MGQPSSPNCYRSAANANGASSWQVLRLVTGSRLGERAMRFVSSLLYNYEDAASRRSSISSDPHARDSTACNTNFAPGGVRDTVAYATVNMSMSTALLTTDPYIINVIT